MGVADDRRGAVDDAGDLDHDAQVGAAAAEVLADARLDLAPAEGDAVVAGDGDLVPPVEVRLGVARRSGRRGGRGGSRGAGGRPRRRRRGGRRRWS